MIFWQRSLISPHLEQKTSSHGVVVSLHRVQSTEYGPDRFELRRVVM